MMDKRGEPISSAARFLDSLPLFSDLRESSLTLLARACRFQSLEKGGILFFQGDASASAYVVRSGKISIVISSPGGRDMVINEMHAGEMFGELGVFTQQPRSTSAVARSRCELLTVPCQALLSVMADEPQLVLRILAITAHRLQVSSERESALAFMDAQARLARLLLELEKQEPERGYITISQDELANRTGLIRQTVAKALGKWRRRGWLITGRGRIVLLDHHALEDLENKLLI